MYRIDSNTIGTHQLHLANADMIPGVVPDRQQYDRHTPITSCKRDMIAGVVPDRQHYDSTHQLHLANADMIPGVNISY